MLSVCRPCEINTNPKYTQICLQIPLVVLSLTEYEVISHSFNRPSSLCPEDSGKTIHSMDCNYQSYRALGQNIDSEPVAQ